ncbi:YdcF family protein [Leptospira brenneri]|uniref:YdcF family protein n=2 Tax=Leptospira brenneri TaxID=2023182 RepID=A0A2M9Y5H6_9LEPT|nr:hypothetical protein CH361_04745 [Leptospira brenneri]TGK97211.1 YdcF family protein [Leptospira brenneri]
MKNHKLKRIVLIVFLISFVYLFFSVVSIVTTGLQEEDDLTSDITLVLGNKVELTGEPSLRLKARLDQTLVLYNSGKIKKVIVSGGIGKEGFDESKVMKQYLVDRKIPANLILEDNLGDNTEKSANNLNLFLEPSSINSIMIVSQYFHLPRAKVLVERAGFKNVKTSYARYFEFRDFYSILRETIALPVVVLIPKIEE